MNHFMMTVSGKQYVEKKDAGAALIKACTGCKDLRHEIPIGEYQGFRLMASYNMFANQYELNIRGHGGYTIEMGHDPIGNITRINNVLESLTTRLDESRRKLDTLNDQLENARIEVVRPFPQEQELTEKQARLAELNSLLNMDEKSSEAAMLDDEPTQSDESRTASAQEKTDDEQPGPARKKRNGLEL